MADADDTRQHREYKSFVDMTAEEQEREIQSCAAYLLGQKERLLMQRPTIESLNNHPRKAECIYTYAEMIDRLDAIQKMLEKTQEEINTIRGHFCFGRLEPFIEVSPEINDASNGAVDAWVKITQARQLIRFRHPPKTRGLTLHKSAARLAHAHFIKKDRHKAREVAHRIIEAAGLEPMDESTLTKWLQEFNKEDDAYEQRRAGM
ncbi:MAG: hypothetical protein AB7U63_17310 [Porticoccaceae bacterium]|jgi:hypothetical protein|nr:hypothetical protein [Halothiobacillus sp.]